VCGVRRPGKRGGDNELDERSEEIPLCGKSDEVPRQRKGVRVEKWESGKTRGGE
jgi:hypothetical protein